MLRTICFLLVFALELAAISPTNAQSLTTLHSFKDGSVPNDGAYSLAALVQGTDGNFYGTTAQGGSAGSGTVFKMTPSGVITILHNFFDGTVANDGMEPQSALVQASNGNFYGTAPGGGANQTGLVFEITPSGVLTVLRTFAPFNSDGTNSDGAYPFANLIIGTDGNFYGTTDQGGSSGVGTIFRLSPAGVLTTLVSFNGTNGALPNYLVQGPDGNFYGTTYGGGSTQSPPFLDSGNGTLFKMTPSGTLTVLHNFGDGSVANDGTLPSAPLVQGPDGSFYSTTNSGGIQDQGVIFKITPTGAVTILHNLANASDGDGDAAATLIVGTDGNFYGAEEGGTTGDGALFEMTPSGTVTILHNFGDGSVVNDANDPVGNLIQARDGNFYGTSEEGGSTIGLGSDNGGYGTVFRLRALTISLSPSSIPIESPAFTLAITGTGFTSRSTVTFGGTPVTVTSQAATQLKVTVPASAITTLGAKTVTVTDPVAGIDSAIFTIVPAWNVQDVAAVADGTGRLLWDRTDGAAGIWALSAGNTKTTVGPTYGPYQGWTAQDVTAAADGTSRILWNRYDGATGVWAMDAHGNQTSVSPTYGPFSGWKAIDLATAPDGTSRLMWRYTSGQAGLLSLNAAGGEIISGRAYGPYTGWTATAVGAAGDGTARMLWTRSDGAMGLWTMDAGDLQKTVGPTYGPYSDSHGTWTATDLSTSADGTSQVLWKRSDGAIGVWTFSASDTALTAGAVYGPYAGFTAAALDAASDKARVLWVQSNRAAGLWSFGTNDLESLIGPVYGPY